MHTYTDLQHSLNCLRRHKQVKSLRSPKGLPSLSLFLFLFRTNRQNLIQTKLERIRTRRALNQGDFREYRGKRLSSFENDRPACQDWITKARKGMGKYGEGKEKKREKEGGIGRHRKPIFNSESKLGIQRNTCQLS
eukprot:1391562-Amorphochlora_amoeboformis.AAC.1